jgi:hypothetical protein
MLRDDVIFFLNTNPNPDDDDLHVWAEEQGYDVHEVETEIYKLATKFVSFLLGGKSNDEGINEEDVDPEQLEMGIEVEYEHTPDEDVAKKIALDHLSEYDTYYTLLKELENKMGVE